MVSRGCLILGETVCSTNLGSPKHANFDRKSDAKYDKTIGIYIYNIIDDLRPS